MSARGHRGAGPVGGGVRADERGSFAIEFALILPVFILLLLGITNFSHMFSVKGRLQDAATEGTRAGSQISDPGAAAARARAAAQDALLRSGVPDGTFSVSTSVGGSPLSVRVDITYQNELFGGAILPQSLQEGAGLNQLRASSVMMLPR